MIERVTYTTQPSAQSMGRYITVYAPDGSYISRHINMEECTESALAHAQANEISGTYRFVPPEKHMSVQIIKTVPGVYTGEYIASPSFGRVSATGMVPTWDTQNPGSGDLWDLWGSRAAPSQFSSLAWPTVPDAPNAVGASSLAQLNSLIVSGNTITLTPGSYTGNITIAASDVHLVLTGCTITGTVSISSSVSRIRFTGGRLLLNGPLNIFNDDTLFYNTNLRANGGNLIVADGESNVQMWNNVNRLAFVLCTLYNGGSARAFIQEAFGGTTCSDLIFAGCDLVGINSNGWGPRINGCSRTILVDTRVLVTAPSQTVRNHADDGAQISGYYGARNQIEEGTWTVDCFSSFGLPGGDITGVYLYDNNFYRNSTAGVIAFNSNSQGTITTVRFEDNTHYTLAGGGAGNMDIQVGSGVTDYSASNNPRSPYVTPPAFAYGSDQ